MAVGQHRNIGADVLRLLSMLMICILHVNLRLSIMDKFPNCLYETVSIQAVNLFAMLTGYFYVEARWKISRYLNLWFQVAFYAVGLTLLGCMMKYMGLFSEYHPDVWRVVLPVPFASGYWYFTSYTAVFLLIPFLNRLIKSLKRGELRTLLLIVVPLFSLMTCFKGSGCLYQHGYNAAWLSALYVMGAYLRLHPLKWGRAATCLVLMSSLAIQTILYITGNPHETGMLGYAFPLVVLSAVCMFHLCLGVAVESPMITRVVACLSPLAFGVYLVHIHHFSWLVLQRVLGLLYNYVGEVWWLVPVFGFGIFVGSLCVDWCRARLFSMLHVPAWSDRLASACPAWLKDLERM